MRKVFWCCAAGLVGCAAAVYAVADHAAKHPDSYLGRCIGPETAEPETGVEESEAPVEGEVPPMPYIEEEDEGTGVCPVDENGCNKWLFKLLEMGGLARATAVDDAEEVPMPAACDDDE